MFKCLTILEGLYEKISEHPASLLDGLTHLMPFKGPKSHLFRLVKVRNDLIPVYRSNEIMFSHVNPGIYRVYDIMRKRGSPDESKGSDESANKSECKFIQKSVRQEQV